MCSPSNACNSAMKMINRKGGIFHPCVTLVMIYSYICHSQIILDFTNTKDDASQIDSPFFVCLGDILKTTLSKETQVLHSSHCFDTFIFTLLNQTRIA